ncbi:membrane protein [Streptomyces phage Zuko]|uniref:Membrane protein n=1 Tax=Streptomyces phage Zuko TaxID=2601695 RepID=A0A5J6D7Q6_9CAUD|nr:membrane protein [Streptomyces phage Zuko]QEQ93616.1 membrane protein [Streptomyces phage Zuko]
MLTLALLAFLLMAGIAAFAALGVEDKRFHDSYVPVRYETMSPMTTRWEDCLPGRVTLPWSETASEWIAAGK